PDRPVRYPASRSPVLSRPREPSRSHPPPDPQPGHPAIRKDVQPHVSQRVAPPRRHGQAVARVGPQRRPGNELPPGSIVRRRAPSHDVAPLETRALAEIALEVGRVQVDALDDAAPAEAQHYPVMTGA